MKKLFKKKTAISIDASYAPTIYHAKYQHADLSLRTLKWINIHTEFLLEIIQDKNRYTLFQQSPYAREECFKVLSAKDFESQRKKIIALLLSFNSHLSPTLSEVDLVKANRDLQWLVQHLAEFRRYCPLIIPFLDAYETFITDQSQLNSAFVCILDKNTLIHLKQTADELPRNLCFTLARIENNHKYTDPAKELEPHYLHIDMVKYFALWFGAQALDAHQFEAPILQAMERNWHFLVKLIQDDYKGSFVGSTYYLTGMGGTSYRRRILNEYHRQLENSLAKLRYEACQQQVKNTLLYEEWLKLQSIQLAYKQNPIEPPSQDESPQDLNYQKALNQVQAICLYDSALRGKQLPPAVASIAVLSTVKKTAPQSGTSTAPIQNFEELEEKEAQPERYPPIKPYLLGLQSLENLHGYTKALVKKLRDSSFWYGTKKQYRLECIALLEEYDDCFRIQNLNEETLLERANACFQKIILGLQNSEALYEFECETQRGIDKEFKLFFAAYTEVLQTELGNLQLMNKKLAESSSNLEQRMLPLKITNAHAESKQSQQLVGAVVKKALKDSNNPHRQALVNIVMVVIHATDLIESPQLLSPLLLILKQSIQVLMPLNKEEETSVLPSDFFPCNRNEDSSQEEKRPNSVVALSDHSLECIHHFTQILAVEYTNYHPENNWSLKFTGVTDRLGGYEDRQSKYLAFCTAIKGKLEAFNQSVDRKSVANANAQLLDLVDYIDRAELSDISKTFHQVYQHESQLATQENAVLLFSWESLKELNKTCLKLVSDVASWESLQYGYLTNKPLILGALNYFNHQFTSQSLQENQDFDKTFKANKALSCLMWIIYKDNEIHRDFSKARLPLLIVEYNRHLEESLRQMHIQANRKALCNRMLDQILRDYNGNRIANCNKQSRFYHQVKKLLDCHSREVYVPALERLISQLSASRGSLSLYLCSQSKMALEQLKAPEKYFSGDDNREEEGQRGVVFAASQAIERPEHPVFLSTSFLRRFIDPIRYISKNGASYHGRDFFDFETGAKKLPSLCLSFLNASTFQQQAESLQGLMGYLSYSPDLNTLDEDKRWSLQLLLSTYSQFLTEYAKEVQGSIAALDSRAEELTAQIDVYQRSYQPSGFFKPLVSKILKEESLRNKAAEAMITLLLSLKEVNVSTFSLIQMALKSLMVVFSPPQNSEVQSLSLKV